MKLITSLAALILSAGVASATTYDLFDHPAGGNVGSYDYGLRMETAPGGGASDYWSFEDIAGTSMVELTVDVGVSTTGSVSGTMRHNLDNSNWTLDLTLTGVTSLAGIGAGAGADSFGATGYTGTLSNSDNSITYNLIGKGKDVYGTSYQWTYFSEDPGGVDWRGPNISAGWVGSLDGGSSMTSGVNDFIGFMEPQPNNTSTVPIPAGGLLLMSALGAFGLARRRRRA